MAALVLVMGAAAMPTHQKLTSQTDDVIPQPMRGREGAWMDHTSGLKHPIDKELARDFTRHHGIPALLPADPSRARHKRTRAQSPIGGHLEMIARVRSR